MKVCMFSFTTCDEYYNTVRRVTRSLAASGHDIRVIAVMGEGTDSFEESDGARIVRVQLDPLIRRLWRLVLWPVKSMVKAAKSIAAKLFPISVDARAGRAGSPRAALRSNAQFLRQALGENPLGFLAAALPGIVFAVIGLPALLLLRIVYAIAARPLLSGTPYRYAMYLDYYYRAYLVARREPFDVCHAHDLITLPVAYVCARLAKAKLVYDSHELWLDRVREPERSRLNRAVAQRIESFLIRRADATILPGLSCSRVMAERYNIDPPHVVLNAPFYRRVERSSLFRDDLGIPQDQVILLCMGRIAPLRGMEEQVLSLKHLSNCSLVFFGLGPDRYISGLRQLIRDEGLSDRVFFHDPVPFEELPRYAASADIGLALLKNTGLNYYYVSPNKLFECMAAGLPMVGSNFPDLRWFIEGYNVGVTCDPDSPVDIAGAVNRVLSDEHRYNEMRRNALEAAKIYNWENESRKLVSIYEGFGS